MKSINLVMVSLGLLSISMSATANEENTISIGYAQSQIKYNGYKLDNDPVGFSLKYRYEFNDNWGAMAAATFTGSETERYKLDSTGLKKQRSLKTEFSSYMIGPTYRFNEYVSAYGNLGVATLKTNEFTGSSVAYGLGLMVNPVRNWSIDLAWEYSKIHDAKVNTLGVGVGYRF